MRSDGAARAGDRSRFNTALKRMVNNDALLEIVEDFFLEHDRKWLYREGQARAIPLVPIPSVAEVLDWEQTRARNYFETIDDPVLGKIRIPGAPLRLHSHRPEPSRPAPRLGEHNREVLGALPGVGASGIETLARWSVISAGISMNNNIRGKTSRPRPLDGMGRTAGSARCWQRWAREVIKVEDTHHFDWWRGSLSMAPPEIQPIERAATFNTTNRGKRRRHPRSFESARNRAGQTPGRAQRYSDRELQPRRDGALRPDLRNSRAAQSAPDHDLDAVVRVRRS